MDATGPEEDVTLRKEEGSGRRGMRLVLYISTTGGVASTATQLHTTRWHTLEHTCTHLPALTLTATDSSLTMANAVYYTLFILFYVRVLLSLSLLFSSTHVYSHTLTPHLCLHLFSSTYDREYFREVVLFLQQPKPDAKPTLHGVFRAYIGRI